VLDEALTSVSLKTATATSIELPETVLPFLLPAEQRTALFLAYAEPQRAYHHIGHVGEVLRHYARVAEGPGWRRPHEVAWAVLYHDAIYLAGRKDNEAASARLAVRHLRRWLPEAGIDIDRIVTLIELTARHGSLRRDALIADHETSEDADDTLHFLDCDMAILAASPPQFEAYDRAIAEEYRAVPRWLYRRKRRQFFQHLLDSERIFLSDFFYRAFEAAARDNLRRSLATG
jgi:predicted metal-dependent HD superfamily phosphohydrolase